MVQLSDLELKILGDIPTSGTSKARAYAVWAGRGGKIEMGPVRWRWEQSQGDAAGMYYECSPFPGAWSTVHESRILRVRHLGAEPLQDGWRLYAMSPGSAIEGVA